jgi:hypothetical protein
VRSDITHDERGEASFFAFVMGFFLIFALVMIIFAVSIFRPQTSMFEYIGIIGLGIVLVALVFKYIVTPGDDEDISDEATSGFFSVITGLLNWRTLLIVVVVIVLYLLVSGAFDFHIFPEKWSIIPDIDLDRFNPFSDIPVIWGGA